MSTITVSKKQFKKVLDDVEVLLTDVSTLLDQDGVAKQRLVELRANPGIAKSKQDFNTYLKSRGV